MTVREALREAEEMLTHARVPSPEVDARIVLAHALGVRLSQLAVLLSREVTETEASRLSALLARRAAREPLAYVVGETEFMGLPFRCDARAFVPRPDTETLVEFAARAIIRVFSRGAQVTVADVGTGTGCIAVSLAHLLPGAQIIATDTSRDALELARGNAALNGVADRVRFLHGPDLEPLRQAGLMASIQALVSNPPYIPSADIPDLEPEVSRSEPMVALDGGADGLTTYRALLDGVGEMPRLGVVAFEFGIGQEESVPELLRAALPGWGSEVVRDLADLPRVVVAAVR